MRQHLDTHVALWMAAGDNRRLKSAHKRLSKGRLLLSPIVIVEMEVLREIGRLSEPVDRILDVLTEHGVKREEECIPEMMTYARTLNFTRDPFDRFIVAHALASKATLITADRHLLEVCRSARWD